MQKKQRRATASGKLSPCSSQALFRAVQDRGVGGSSVGGGDLVASGVQCPPSLVLLLVFTKTSSFTFLAVAQRNTDTYAPLKRILISLSGGHWSQWRGGRSSCWASRLFLICSIISDSRNHEIWPFFFFSKSNLHLLFHHSFILVRINALPSTMFPSTRKHRPFVEKGIRVTIWSGPLSWQAYASLTDLIWDFPASVPLWGNALDFSWKKKSHGQGHLSVADAVCQTASNTVTHCHRSE